MSVVVRRLRLADFRPTYDAMVVSPPGAVRKPGRVVDRRTPRSSPWAGPASRTPASLGISAFPVVPIDRGGQVTYHGPAGGRSTCCSTSPPQAQGARVVQRHRTKAVIDLLGDRGVTANATPAPRRLYRRRASENAALGLRIRHGCSYHGVSLNVDMDLRPFDAINPCMATPGSVWNSDAGSQPAAHRSQGGRASLRQLHSNWRTAKMAERGIKQRANKNRPHPGSRSSPWTPPQRNPIGSGSRPATAPGALAKSRPCCGAEAPHRLRRSHLPQHRRMLRPRYRHLHDPRRHLHAPLPFCDVGHGQPLPPTPTNRSNLAGRSWP